MLAKSSSSSWKLNGLSVVATSLLIANTSLGQVPAPPAAPAIAQPQNALPAPNGQDGMQVLDQGPIHEAFAEAVVLEADQGIVIKREPPEPINELVPEVRPEGQNVEWIPGYWMWSDQQNDFIWVSGVWRDIPPGRRWVPGNWTALGGGDFQWVPGFWAGEQVQEVQMLPLPPETVEAGPSSPAPAANYFWVPGCWLWNNGAYGWRAGYWYAGQPNWVWIPDRYCYTPGGVIFVSGYWDYLLAYRGLAYAPVWWSRPVWGVPGWGYRPYNAINSSLLLSALFLNRHHHHYYFGHGNWNNNYRPWWQNGGGRGYDPFCSYHRWHDGRNRDDWANNYRRDFDRFQQDFNRPGNAPHRNQLVTQADIRQRQQIGDVKLQQVSKVDLDRSRQQIDQFKNIRDSRLQAQNHLHNVGGNLNVDELKNRKFGQQGRQADDGNGDGRPGGAEGSGKLAGLVDRDVIRSGGRKLEIGDSATGGNATFKLPPVTRTTAKVPTVGGNVAAGPRFVGRGQGSDGQSNAQGGNRSLSNGADHGRSMNGVKFEDLQRQLRRGDAPPMTGNGRSSLPGGIDALPNRAVTGGANDRGDLFRSGRTLTPNGPGSDAEASRSRGGVVRADDLRRQLNLDGSSAFPQGSGRTLEGRARVEMPQNRLPTPGNVSRPPEMQFRSRNLQVPGGDSSPGQPRTNQGSSGGPALRGLPSGGDTRSLRSSGAFNAAGGAGGGQPIGRGPGSAGTEMRSFRGSSFSGGGAGLSMQRSHGSSSDGGGSAFRSGGGGGGGGVGRGHQGRR
ncbi:hypothetical protein [Lacipirellula limnantheis]|uniref:YXWGXW repeat (2 copies) n=1 Tax=Lacipirellula limnantheis TaxID=2528024 RepID=A0A517TWY5_9BACT|nr:hypothetical protein [Lacipirellula limnantheis]QDT72881.1 hypothetical protein I41_20660 [Lacipirellula limnantheis]